MCARGNYDDGKLGAILCACLIMTINEEDGHCLQLIECSLVAEIGGGTGIDYIYPTNIT